MTGIWVNWVHLKFDGQYISARKTGEKNQNTMVYYLNTFSFFSPIKSVDCYLSVHLCISKQTKTLVVLDAVTVGDCKCSVFILNLKEHRVWLEKGWKNERLRLIKNAHPKFRLEPCGLLSDHWRLGSHQSWCHTAKPLPPVNDPS